MRINICIESSNSNYQVISNLLENELTHPFSGDQNHGSPMMQQSMRSQTPGMTPVPNNQGMPGQPPRMGGGPQGNVS